MGSSLSTPNSLNNQIWKFGDDLNEQYSIYKQNHNDPRLCQIDIYEHKHNQDEYVAVKPYKCISEQDYHHKLEELNKFIDLKHKNIVQILGIQGCQQQMCATISKLKVYYEYYGSDLKLELQQRKSSNQELSEIEIWYIFDSLVEVIHYLKRHKRVMKYLKMDHIMLSNDGLVKLLVQQEQKGLNRLLQFDDIYFSPQQIQQFNSNQTEIDDDIEYSLAIVIIYCCTLEDPIKTIYTVGHQNSFTINQQKLQDNLQLIKYKYSHQFLGNLLEKMLDKDSKTRFDIQMVNSILLPYRNDIQKMKDFTSQLSQKEKGSYEIIHSKNRNENHDSQQLEFLKIFSNDQDKQKQVSNSNKYKHFQFGRKQQFGLNHPNTNHRIEFKNISMVNSNQSESYSQFMEKRYMQKYQNIFIPANLQSDQSQNNQQEYNKDRFQNELDQMFKANFMKNDNPVIYSQTYSNSNLQSQQKNMNEFDQPQIVPVVKPSQTKPNMNVLKQPHLQHLGPVSNNIKISTTNK